MSSHVVYAAYNVAREPIYIGRTVDFDQRQRQHAVQAPWFPEADTWSLIHVPDSQAAHRLESDLIRRFRPRYNIMLNPDHPSAVAPVHEGPMPETVADRKAMALAALRAERDALRAERGAA